MHKKQLCVIRGDGGGGGDWSDGLRILGHVTKIAEDPGRLRCDL